MKLFCKILGGILMAFCGIAVVSSLLIIPAWIAAGEMWGLLMCVGIVAMYAAIFYAGLTLYRRGSRAKKPMSKKSTKMNPLPEPLPKGSAKKWKLDWQSGLLDEIGLVYEKAEKDEETAERLRQLEEQALAQAQAACGSVGILVKGVGDVLTPQQFGELSELDKETAIKMLADAGLGLTDVRLNMKTAVIAIQFSALISKTHACTIFSILNLLEKLDGANNLLHPEWTLELQIPLGGREGLFQWKMLIMRLHPLITVREVASNQVIAEK